MGRLWRDVEDVTTTCPMCGQQWTRTVARWMLRYAAGIMCDRCYVASDAARSMEG